jgi:hypothetical protein
VTGTLKDAEVPAGHVPIEHVMSYWSVLHENGGPESCDAAPSDHAPGPRERTTYIDVPSMPVFAALTVMVADPPGLTVLGAIDSPIE